jgi:ABC-2 type transport system permease protein
MSAARHVFWLGLKELISLWHDPVLLGFIAYAFTVSVIMSVNQAVEVRNASLAIVDEDRSALSSRLQEAFLPPRFQRPVPLSLEAMSQGLQSGRYTFGLDIPPRFEADVRAGKRPALQLNVDATAVAQAFNGASDIAQVVALEVARFAAPGEHTAPSVRPVLRIRYNPNKAPGWFLSVAQLVMMVTVLSMVLPAVALIREREHGTIGHLLALPLTPAEILLAKIWTNALVVQAGTLACLEVVIHRYLQVPLAGSVLLFLGGTAAYQFAATAIGMLVATMVRTVPQFILLNLLIVAPMIFLSGVFTPAESMPPLLYRLMTVSPLRHYVDLSAAVLFRGAGAADVWREIAMMAGLGAALFAAALLRFRHQMGPAR